ncbi:MAG TPA: IS110 family transposase [Chloroflexi bacterium]|jgi:transposase|nr:IS110 family transposase [Chloroflexota bacterium]HAL26721.1 IS110 family transposase [Chloroflexota bacterium]
MLNCGVDWASDHHDVCIVDADGTVRWRKRIGHDPEGIALLRAAIADGEPDPAQVAVAVETSHGLLVSALVEAGYVVYPINPKAAERFRDRRKPSGGKNDRLDAEVLAQAVRTDRASLRPLLPDSPRAVEIATLARDRHALVREQTRLTNQLRSALNEYFPAALIAFDLGADSTLAFLARYPTPAAAAKLSAFQIASFLKARRANRDLAAKAAAAKEAFRAPALRARPEIARAKARLVRVRCAQLQALRPELSAYERELDRLLKTHPEGELFRSLPGLGVILASRVLAGTGDNPARFASAAGLCAYAGTAPMLIQSGKRAVVKARHACPKEFRDAVQQWADQARRRSPWAAEFYRRHRERGHNHNESLRALGNRLLELLFDLRRRGLRYDEAVHAANIRWAA